MPCARMLPRRAPKRTVFQIADVHKPLLSITACSDTGYDWYLGKEGGSLRDRVTGEGIPLDRRGPLYSSRCGFGKTQGAIAIRVFSGRHSDGDKPEQ